MTVTVKLKHLRISSRKVRLVANTIRRKSAVQAMNSLEYTIKKAADPILKLLKSGIATAEKDFGYEKSNLYISKIFVDEGPTLKRSRPRARGQWYPILKRTSHVTISLDEIKKTDKPKKTVKKTVAKTEKVADKKKIIKKPVQTKAKDAKIKTKPGFQKVFRRKSF